LARVRWRTDRHHAVFRSGVIGNRVPNAALVLSGLVLVVCYNDSMDSYWPRLVPVKRYLNLSDLRGLSRLAIDVAAEVTDVVEAMHYTIASTRSLSGASTPGRTRGTIGLLYRNIHGCYYLMSASMDAVLGQVIPLFGDPPSTPEREAVLAALNGLWGDYLVTSANPLAIEMSVRHGGRSLVLERHAIQAVIPQSSGKVVVLAHGLCMNDLRWSRSGHDHGTELARDLGYTPVYLHYNSGLHISTNGRRFADLLETLVREWPQPVEELAIIGHSMGGLVARSACHYGTVAGHTWRQHLRKLIFLGTPHHGSPLERAGNWADVILKATRFTAPIGHLGTKRSAGITDLRYGNLLDEDWDGLDRFAHRPDSRRPVPLPGGVRCYAIGASIGTRAGDVKDRLVGDGVVPLDSALGYNKDPHRCLAFPQSQQWAGYNMGHADLLDRPEVYQKIKEWLE
jgi:pimeloyl-ACP methyl ester carboxylesterase